MPPAQSRHAYRRPEAAISTSATAETAAPGVTCDEPRLTPYAATRATSARPSATAAILTGSQRARARDNAVMPAVSQALIAFANHHRQEAAPGIDVVVTPRYRATIQPDFPIGGPNNVGLIRCKAGEANDEIREARAIFAASHLPLIWTLGPGAEPSEL